MSRIGRAPIAIPQGVQVDIHRNTVTVTGPKGQLTRTFHPDMKISKMDDQLLVERPTDNGIHRALHGLTRTLLANMVTGVATGFKKVLEVTGVGYRVSKQDNRLVMQLGYSHPIEIVPPPGIEVSSVETFTPTTANGWLSARITLSGTDKETVGQLAAKIRELRAVEPYKGKGIKYLGERVRRKAGKAGKAAKGRK
ncbi:MAG: 50S ribosomal protein L6 [Chloroflexi bacterium]|nr:50S ribosomal protein L6 [Chloroflexota bacterium]MDA8189117.1 50S ribosomal protein L6 [Dehalococcoidales bacterium]